MNTTVKETGNITVVSQTKDRNVTYSARINEAIALHPDKCPLQEVVDGDSHSYVIKEDQNNMFSLVANTTEEYYKLCIKGPSNKMYGKQYALNYEGNASIIAYSENFFLFYSDCDYGAERGIYFIATKVFNTRTGVHEWRWIFSYDSIDTTAGIGLQYCVHAPTDGIAHYNGGSLPPFGKCFPKTPGSNSPVIGSDIAYPIVESGIPFSSPVVYWMPMSQIDIHSSASSLYTINFDSKFYELDGASERPCVRIKYILLWADVPNIELGT